VLLVRAKTGPIHCCVLALTLVGSHVSNLIAQTPPRVVHVFVALADNVNQGIVPVPAKLGNGQDPDHNLYWGAAGGVKTYFARSKDWQLLAHRQRPKPEILERCLFKHRTANTYLVADAYQGDRIKHAISDFLEASAGGNPEDVAVPAASHALRSPRATAVFAADMPAFVHAGGNANLVAYVGHDGFMDFQLSSLPRQRNLTRREAIILACISKTYFAEPLRSAGAHPLLWTTGLMAPEAYTLKDALDGWVLGEADERIRERAAAAYDRYQKCGMKGARRLLVSGW
jgi:hypothetical protein